MRKSESQSERESWNNTRQKEKSADRESLMQNERGPVWDYLGEQHFTKRSADAILAVCPSGGTGRRAGLKIRWPQGRDGSTPFSGTKIFWKIAYGSEPYDPRIRTHLRNTLCLCCFGRSASVACGFRGMVINDSRTIVALPIPHCYQLLPITAKICYTVTYVDTSA